MQPTFEEAVMRRLGLLACEVCATPGPHRIIRVHAQGVTAVCPKCGDPQTVRSLN